MDYKYTIGCETTGASLATPAGILEAFRDLDDPSATLLLICGRDANSDFSIRNHIEKNGLSDRVTCLQYYHRHEYHHLKKSCRVWIGKNVPADMLSRDVLKAGIADSASGPAAVTDGKKRAVFFTGFHPYNREGHGAYMRLWLDSLRKTGHEIHLVYYQHDWRTTPEEVRHRAAKDFQHYYEIPVTSRLVGINESGLNIDLDDWCGIEALDGVSALANRYDFDLGLVFYPFYSAVLEVLPPDTRKVIVASDSFTDRNRNMLARGFSEARWASITREGEQEACRRADVIAAIKEEDAEHFEKLIGDREKIVSAPFLSPQVEFTRSPYSGKLRIGYFASSSRTNVESFVEFLECRSASQILSANSEVRVAGGVCSGISSQFGEQELREKNIEFLGYVDDLRDLYAATDLIVNPDKGGTGLKIKTVEPMYFGMPVACTADGGSGLKSSSRFHNAADPGGLIALLEEIIGTPQLLDELSAASREVSGEINRMTMEGISLALQSPESELDPGEISAGELDSPALRRAETAGDSSSEEPLISIVLPFFNAEANLAKAVRSVSEHDYRNIELILVDDASRDNSRRIAETLAREDDRIRVLEHPENMGAGPARNTGALNAKGEYLFFIDSDDIMRRHSLDLLVRTAREQEVKLVIGSCNQVDKDGNYGDYDRDRDGGRPEVFGLIDGIDAMCRSLNVEQGSFLPVRPWGMLIDAGMFRESGLTFPSGEYEDLSVLPFLYKFAGKVVYLPDIVVTYRIREGSVTHSLLNLDKVARYRNLWRVISDRIEMFGLEGYRREFKVFHIGHLLWLLDQGVTEKAVLNAAAELINDEMRLDLHESGAPGDLHYMVGYLSKILGAARLEKDFRLWDKFVSHLGDEAVAGYFRHKVFEMTR